MTTTTILDTIDLSTNGKNALEADGAYDDNVMRVLRSSDVSFLSLGDQAKLRMRFPNLDPAAVSGGVAPRSNQIRDRMKDQKEVTEEVLHRIGAGDLSPDLLQLASEVRIDRIVVDVDGHFLEDGSFGLIQHLADGKPLPSDGLWKDCPIVSLSEYVRGKVVRRHPITGDHLQDGQDPVTLIKWGDLNVTSAALVHWAFKDGLLRDLSEMSIFHAALDPSSNLMLRARDRMKAKRDNLDRAIDFVTDRCQDTVTMTVSTISAGTPREALYKLFLACYDASTLRLAIDHTFPEISRILPGPSSSEAHLADAAAASLMSHGVAVKFLDAMKKSFPARTADILFVMSFF